MARDGATRRRRLTALHPLMAFFRVPPRSRRVELLDCAGIDGETRIRALRDVARANVYFGGTRAVVKELLRAVSHGMGQPATVLDVGGGIGDIALRVEAVARRRGIALRTIGVDVSDSLARAARDAGVMSVCGDGRALPFADGSVDIVVCSQLLHHFHDGDTTALLRELDRVARHVVIVCDLRRSRLAAGAFGLVAPLLRFHSVSRHDGVVSVLRAFTAGELRALVRAAVGLVPEVRRHPLFRLAATWTPRRNDHVSSGASASEGG